ncbi:MAG: putative signal transducing protein [Planctomycetota bacterium]|jgi:uncharacterized caspase-like protein
MHEDEKLVTIDEFQGEFDAELAKLTLENAGIEAVVFGEDLVTNLPHINAIKVELQVFEKDAEKAKQILAEKAEQGDENDESDQ